MTNGVYFYLSVFSYKLIDSVHVFRRGIYASSLENQWLNIEKFYNAYDMHTNNQGKTAFTTCNSKHFHAVANHQNRMGGLYQQTFRQLPIY